MAIPARSGYYDIETTEILPDSTSTWSGLSSTTWADWTSWNYAPASTITWHVPVVDLGAPDNFTLNISTVSTGTISYQIYTSNTGAFQGEETETLVANGATTVASFNARYLFVVVVATLATDALKISSISITPVKSTVLEFRYDSLDSSTLSGSSTSRVLPLPQTVSRVVDIIITPQQVTSYALDLYVSSTANSTYVIPKVISKSAAGPTFALVGLDNQPRDATVDIVVKALPNQFMSGNNLVTR
jgi:hypothetical protein